MKDRIHKNKNHQQYISRKKEKKKRKKTKCRVEQKKTYKRTYYHNSNLQLQYILSFNDIFPGEQKIDINKTLAQYSRGDIIKFACSLYTYCDKTDIKKSIQNFFYPDRKTAINVIKRFNKTHKTEFIKDYFFCTNQTILELLRYSFSISHTQTPNICTKNCKLIMFKILLLLNDIITDYNLNSENRNNLNDLIFINNASNKYILDTPIEDQLNTQFYLAKEFFQYISFNKEYEQIYSRFLDKYKIDNWKKYIRTITELVLSHKNMSYEIDQNFTYKKGDLIDTNILKNIYWEYNCILKFKSDNQMDKDGNSDYRLFRSKPLILMPNDNYLILNKSFLIDKLYNGLYFDIMELLPKQKNPSSLFTYKFIEKHIFNNLIKESASNKKYKLIPEEDCKRKHKYTKGELGPPDYILESSNSVILFECKDIRLNGWILEQRDFNSLIEEIQNKLLIKKWSYENGIKKYKEKNQWRKVGVGQLAEHVMNITLKNFKYTNTNKSKDIYPVLILGNHIYNFDGLYKIINNWYNNELGISKNSHCKPIIILSISTLIKYHKLFYNNGFEQYFESYLSTKDPSIYSFDDYMENYKSNIEKEYNNIRKKLSEL